MRFVGVRWVLGLSLVVNLSADADGAHSNDGAAPQEVSSAFRRDINSASGKLPERVLKLIADNHITLTVVPLLNDARLNGMKPPHAERWDQVRGVLIEKDIFVAEYVMRGEEFERETDPAGLLFHEVGHAYDSIRGVSHQPEFLKAYKADYGNAADEIEQLEDNSGPHFQHFLSPGDVGPREAFAQAFGIGLRAVSLKRSLDETPDDPLEQRFVELFPRVFAYVAQTSAGDLGVTELTPAQSIVAQPTTAQQADAQYVGAQQAGAQPAVQPHYVLNGTSAVTIGFPRNFKLLPPGLNGSSGAGMLHVDVPDGARVKIHVNDMPWETQSRNWSRYRHYRIPGLDSYRSIRICVEVTLERDLPGCKQQRYKCIKSVPMKAGDNELLRFHSSDFLDENAETVDLCEPSEPAAE